MLRPRPALLLATALTLTAIAGCSGSPPSCSDSSCATQEIQGSLIGLQAKDGAAVTKAACKGAVRNAGDTWTAACVVTESDGSVSHGSGNWFVSTSRVTYEPAGTGP